MGESKGNYRIIPNIAEVFALWKLCFRPAKALHVLYAPVWPCFFLTLLSLTLIIPFAGNWSSGSANDGKDLFLLISRYLTITPEEFHRYYFYISSFVLMVMVMLGGIAQKVLFSLQGRTITLVDSVASLCYSVFPILVSLIVFYCVELLTQTQQRVVTGGLIVTTSPLDRLDEGVIILRWLAHLLVIVVPLWSLYVWYRAAQLISKLPPSRVIASEMLLLLGPLLIVIVISLSLTFQFRGGNNEAEMNEINTDRLRDSLKRSLNTQPKPKSKPKKRERIY